MPRRCHARTRSRTRNRRLRRELDLQFRQVLCLVPGMSADGAAAADIVLPPPRVEPYRGPRPHKKGPLVFLDYDQIELDAAYDQQVYQPNIVQVAKRWASNSARTRTRLGEPERISYGPTEIERLDIFRTEAPAPAPIFIFIHGGAWARSEA